LLYFHSTILYFSLLYFTFTLLYFTSLHITLLSFTALYFAILFLTLLHFTLLLLHFNLLYYILLYYTLLYFYFILLYFTLLYFTLLYYTFLYFTSLLLYFTLHKCEYSLSGPDWSECVHTFCCKYKPRRIPGPVSARWRKCKGHSFWQPFWEGTPMRKWWSGRSVTFFGRALVPGVTKSSVINTNLSFTHPKKKTIKFISTWIRRSRFHRNFPSQQIYCTRSFIVVCLVQFTLNYSLMARQRNNSSSDVTATTCFGHTTIIKWHTVVYCLKLFAWLQQLLAG
jgi:hypothetical protein